MGNLFSGKYRGSKIEDLSYYFRFLKSTKVEILYRNQTFDEMAGTPYFRQ